MSKNFSTDLFKISINPIPKGGYHYTIYLILYIKLK